jgi:hypothetical protein
MASAKDDERDALDRTLAQAAQTLRSARRPEPLPRPTADEPSDDELLRVIDGVASLDERARVDAAAKRSAFTRDRLADLGAALAETGHAPSPLTRAARYVFVLGQGALELLRSATEPVAFAAPARLRSSGGATSPPSGAKACYYEFVQPLADVEARLKIEHVTKADASASIDVQLRLVGPSRGARVSLTSEGKTLDSLPVDDAGVATFSGLGQARYELEVRRAGASEAVGKVRLDFLRS